VAGGLGTQLRADEPHHQVLDHSQAVCTLLTLLSSDGVASRSDTVLTTSWPGQWQPAQHLQMNHKSTRQGEDQLQEADREGGDSADWAERQPA
jgi:hypothetical protein